MKKILFLSMSFVVWGCHACEIKPSGDGVNEDSVTQEKIDLQVMKLRDAIVAGDVEQVSAANKEIEAFQHELKVHKKIDVDIINQKDINGHTPLILAIVNNFEPIVYKLLEHGAKVDVTDHHNCSALHWATRKGNAGMVQILLANNANIEAQDNIGMTALHWAAFWGRKAIAQLLLAKKANVNVLTREGLTPLHCAAFKGDWEMVNLLRDFGADIKTADKNGLTAARCAGQQKHGDLVFFLQKYSDWPAMQQKKYAAQLAFCSAMHKRAGVNSTARKLSSYLAHEVLQYVDTIDYPQMIPTKIMDKAKTKKTKTKKHHCVIS